MTRCLMLDIIINLWCSSYSRTQNIDEKKEAAKAASKV